MKILIPTDFSQNAERACRFAANNFGHIEKLEITLVHVFHIPRSGATMMRSIEPEMRAEAGVQMERTMANLVSLYPDIEWDQLIHEGVVGDVVNELAKQDSADLVIMGTTGTSGYIENFLGSNASHIIQSGTGLLIAVPHDAPIEKIDHILFATDFKNDKYKDRVIALADLAQKLGASIDILHVSTEELQHAEFEGELPELQLFNDRDIDYRMHFAFEKESDVEEAILRNAHQCNAQLIATIPHHEKFFDRLLHRSVAKGLTLHSDVPVLVIKQG